MLHSLTLGSHLAAVRNYVTFSTALEWLRLWSSFLCVWVLRLYPKSTISGAAMRNPFPLVTRVIGQ
ncbi:MAG: hypothetical protein Q6K80_03970 [Thermostichus sp. DG_1_6_bins_120]